VSFSGQHVEEEEEDQFRDPKSND